MWSRIVEELSKPTRGKVEVNIDSIEKMAQKTRVKLLVPRKIAFKWNSNSKLLLLQQVHQLVQKKNKITKRRIY